MSTNDGYTDHEGDRGGGGGSGGKERFVIQAVHHCPPDRRASIDSVPEEEEVTTGETEDNVPDITEFYNNNLSVDLKPSSSRVSLASEGGVETPAEKALNRKRSSFLLPPRPLKHYLTREKLPHMDHYRNRLSFSNGKRDTIFSIIIILKVTLW